MPLALLFCAGMIVLLICVPAFCATENTDEKNPVAAFGCVSVPPGVLASSTVGVRGELIEEDSLEGRVADCARLCRMLSTEFRLFGEEETKAFAKVLLSVLGSVGVGGVMKVVGVLSRVGDVVMENGRAVRD